MTLSTGNITGRVVKSETDKWGRWTSQTFRGLNQLKLTIISAYQVGTTDPEKGAITAAVQQRNLLMLTNDPLNDPRKAFKRDLSQFIQEKRSQGDEIILVGDFNEKLGEPNNGIEIIAGETGLINMMSYKHPTRPPATYARGSHCIDYGFATPHVVQALSNCGYEAFNARYSTDHRSYFFDFNTVQLFGRPTSVLVAPSQRILQSTNVKQVTKYIKEKYDYLCRCNAFARAQRLTLPGNRHQFAERLDKDMLQASLYAEKQTKRYGAPAWSIALDQARKRVTILKKCLSMIRTRLDLTSTVETSNGMLNEPMELPRTKRECCLRLREAKAKVKEIVNASYAQRDKERKQRIMQLEISGGVSEAKQARILRRLQKAEQLKSLMATIRNARTSGTRQGVTSIEIPEHPEDDPKTCTEWRIIDVPTEVVRQLQKRNQKHFGQAHGTPFTVPPLATELGFCGDQPGTAAILEGRFDSTSYGENVQLLLRHLQQIDEIAQHPNYPTIGESDFIGKLQAWRENTTTSPSGLHLGHYKALIARHQYSDDDPEMESDGQSCRDEWNHMQQALRTFHLQLINYALERGYSYSRWQSIINTILFKEENNIRIHRTRVIHIYEADYNLVLSLKWRIAVYQAEALKVLNEGQYGSRPRRNAIDPVMIEEMQLEISRLSRRMFIQVNYDATACYDRIIPNLAMLASQKFGVHPMVTKCNATTLQKAKYKVRTELGISEEAYSHCLEDPIYGIGQGAGNSSNHWGFITSAAYDAYDTKATPATYQHPDRTNVTKVSIVGFVDDNNGQANKFDGPQNTEELQWLVEKSQENARLWAGLLEATGGALELSKCSYHIVFWKFSMQGAPILTNTSSEVQPIEVMDPYTNSCQPLQYLSPYTAHKTLGYYKEPAGIQKAQFDKLLEKSDGITSFLWKTPLNRIEAWTYYTSCYLPSICYPLTGSYMSQAQLDKIQRKAMSIIIPRCGYNRTTHRAIIYGPREMGGAGFRHLHVEQGVQQTLYFLRQWRLDSHVGRLLKCAIAWLQVSVGVSYPVLEYPSRPLPHIESLWIASMRQFLAHTDTAIQLDDPCLPPVQREHDIYIMDMILNCNHYTPNEIKKLNYCRLYANITLLSDCTTPCGTKFDMKKADGQPTLTSSRSHHLAIHQEKPSAKEWKQWQRAWLLWCDLQGNLRTPLGKWLVPPSQQRQQHFAYARNNILWIRQEDENNYVEFQQFAVDEGYLDMQRTVAITDIPSEAVPVEVNYNEDTTTWSCTSPPQWHNAFRRPPTPALNTFVDLVRSLSPWEQELLQHTEYTAEPYDLCCDLQPHLRAVSDGSVRCETQGAFGWAMRNEHGVSVATGMGPARGGGTITSYRAEAYGLLALMRFLIRMAEFTEMQQPWIGRIATDSLSLLDTLRGKDDTRMERERDEPINLSGSKVELNCISADWDVLIEIQDALTKLPQICLQHVKGHQDRHRAYQNLDQLGQLNVDADERAGVYQDRFGATRPIVLMMPKTKAHLIGQTGTVTGKYAAYLRRTATTPTLHQYLMAKYTWSEAVVTSINWDAHRSALKRFTKKRAHFTKLVFDILPTNSLLNKFDNGRRKCPSCSCLKEDRDHTILKCRSTGRVTWRINFMDSIAEFCRTTQTDSELQTLLRTSLEMWFSDFETEPLLQTHQFSPRLHRLIQQQNQIGWRQMFNGRFGSEWSKVQNDAYSRRPQHGDTQIKRTGAKWQTQLIVHIWTQWELAWSDRNNALHGHNLSTQNTAIRREVRRQLEVIYQNRQMMEPSVQELLLENPMEHDQQQLTTTRNWLAVHGPVFRESIRRVRNRAIQNVRSIRSYFTPTVGG